jgi:hypothetical protein
MFQCGIAYSLAPNPINFTKEVIKDGDREYIVTNENGVIDMKVRMDGAVYSWDGEKFIKEEGGLAKLVAKIGDIVLKAKRKDVYTVKELNGKFYTIHSKGDEIISMIEVPKEYYPKPFWKKAVTWFWNALVMNEPNKEIPWPNMSQKVEVPKLMGFLFVAFLLSMAFWIWLVKWLWRG